MLNQSSIFIVIAAKTCTFFLKITPSMTNAKFSDLETVLEIGFEWKKRRDYFVKSVNCFFFSSADYLLFLHQGDFTLKKKKKTRVKRIWEKRKNQEKTWKRASIFFALDVSPPNFFFPPSLHYFPFRPSTDFFAEGWSPSRRVFLTCSDETKKIPSRDELELFEGIRKW